MKAQRYLETISQLVVRLVWSDLVWPGLVFLYFCHCCSQSAATSSAGVRGSTRPKRRVSHQVRQDARWLAGRRPERVASQSAVGKLTFLPAP